MSDCENPEYKKNPDTMEDFLKFFVRSMVK
jgi:hypothetical protein